MIKLKKLFLIFSMTLILVFSIDYCRYTVNGFLDSQKITKISFEKELKATTGEIKKDTEIYQKFIANKNNLCGFEIFFSTYNRQNTGDISICVLDEQFKIIEEQKINCSKLQDNKYQKIYFEPIKNCLGKVYYISIKSDNSQEGNAVTAWYNPNKLDSNIKLNGKKVNGALVFNTIYKNQVEISNMVKNTLVLFIINSVIYGLVKFLRK